jgi:hypothetical protein
MINRLNKSVDKLNSSMDKKLNISFIESLAFATEFQDFGAVVNNIYNELDLIKSEIITVQFSLLFSTLSYYFTA